jgi:hypothetical protein
VLPAPPVVADADVLLRNVDYQVRRGRVAALSDAAAIGTNVFAVEEVRAEVLKHLADIVARRGAAPQFVAFIWAGIASRIRFVTLAPDAAKGDPRLAGVDPKDLPTARLACVLAPTVLCTDNQRHFRPFFSEQHRIDPVAIDLRTLAQLDLGLRGTMVLPAITAGSLAHGAKQLSRLVGRDTAVVLGLGIAALTAVIVGTERARSARARIVAAGHEVGPPLAQFLARAQQAGERVQGVTVPPGEVPLALNRVARRLLGPFHSLSTSEIAELLQDGGFSFGPDARHATATRAWLVSQPCFAEEHRGHWSFGRMGSAS